MTSRGSKAPGGDTHEDPAVRARRPKHTHTAFAVKQLRPVRTLATRSCASGARAESRSSCNPGPGCGECRKSSVSGRATRVQRSDVRWCGWQCSPRPLRSSVQRAGRCRLAPVDGEGAGRCVQVGAVAGHRLLHRTDQVTPQVPAIGDLDGLGRTGTGAVSVRSSPIPAHDLTPRRSRSHVATVPLARRTSRGLDGARSHRYPGPGPGRWARRGSHVLPAARWRDPPCPQSWSASRAPARADLGTSIMAADAGCVGSTTT